MRHLTDSLYKIKHFCYLIAGTVIPTCGKNPTVGGRHVVFLHRTVSAGKRHGRAWDTHTFKYQRLICFRPDPVGDKTPWHVHCDAFG